MAAGRMLFQEDKLYLLTPPYSTPRKGLLFYHPFFIRGNTREAAPPVGQSRLPIITPKLSAAIMQVMMSRY